MRVPWGRVQPGCATTKREEYFLVTPPRSRPHRLPGELSVSFRAHQGVFHYVLAGAHVKTNADYSKRCDDLVDELGGGTGEPGRELEDLNTASATVNMAVCAVDVLYEPLTVPEILECQRYKEIKGRLQRIAGRIGSG